MEYTVAEFESELERFLNRSKCPPARERVRLATQFLKANNEPTDMLHTLVALKALDSLPLRR